MSRVAYVLWYACSIFAAMLVVVIVGVGIVSLIKRTQPKQLIAGELCDRVYAFRPQPTITAYQLATIIVETNGLATWNVVCVSDAKPIRDDLLDQFVRIK